MLSLKTFFFFNSYPCIISTINEVFALCILHPSTISKLQTKSFFYQTTTTKNLNYQTTFTKISDHQNL